MTLSFFITVIPDHDKPQPPGCLLGISTGKLVARIHGSFADAE
ncbi:hemolysin activation protein [Salmonella enterica subsp. enterica serovar Typhimurium]|nr:hemolysin activation protein [Salmonella enterica subsp. enterica serovar Typhimurium]